MKDTIPLGSLAQSGKEPSLINEQEYFDHAEQEPTPPAPAEQIEALNDELYERAREIKALKAACEEKQITITVYRTSVAMKLGTILTKIEAKPCSCGMARCARCEASNELRTLLGLPLEPDKSLAMIPEDAAQALSAGMQSTMQHKH